MNFYYSDGVTRVEIGDICSYMCTHNPAAKSINVVELVDPNKIGFNAHFRTKDCGKSYVPDYDVIKYSPLYYYCKDWNTGGMLLIDDIVKIGNIKTDSEKLTEKYINEKYANQNAKNLNFWQTLYNLPFELDMQVELGIDLIELYHRLKPIDHPVNKNLHRDINNFVEKNLSTFLVPFNILFTGGNKKTLFTHELKYHYGTKLFEFIQSQLNGVLKDHFDVEVEEFYLNVISNYTKWVRYNNHNFYKAK